MENQPTPPAAPQPPIHWDHSEVRDLHHPNVCNVSTQDDGFMLLFGAAQSDSDQNITVKVGTRALLVPLAAKMLGDLLADHLQRYEATHGTIPTSYQPLPGSRPLPNTTPELLISPGELPDKGALLLELFDGLNLRYDLERSFKVFQGHLLTNRFLLTLAKDALVPVRSRLPVICKRLGMPEDYAQAFLAEYQHADFVHFGFEENETGAVFKAYLEQVEGVLVAMQSESQVQEPFLLYRGFKWDVADRARKSISSYVCHPCLPMEALKARVAECIPDPAHQPTLEIATDILAIAGASIAQNDLLYVDVTEDTSSRHSFDLNLYAGKLQLAEFYPVLLSICSRFAIDPTQFHALYNRFKNRTFGHVSGGVDRQGRDFLTIYFGRERHAALA